MLVALETITTLNDSIATNKRPMDTSSGRGECERTTLMPTTITRAANSAPSIALPPRR
jgi:hypothetical protein